MAKKRLFELAISFTIYILVTTICISIILSIDFKSKIDIIKDRTKNKVDMLEQLIE